MEHSNVLILGLFSVIGMIYTYNTSVFADHATYTDNDLLSKPSFDIHNEIFEGVDFEYIK